MVDTRKVNASGPMRRSRDAGFSFLEMLAVITILATLGVLVVPHLSDSHTNKLRAAAELFVADCEYAQAESIAHGDDLRMVTIASPTKYFISASSALTTPIIDPVTKGAYSVTYGSGRANMLSDVTISSNLVNTARFGFGVYGELTQLADVIITLSCGGSTCVVTIKAPSGQAIIGAIN